VQRIGPPVPGGRHQRVGVEIGLGQGPARKGHGEIGLAHVRGGRVLGGEDGHRLDPRLVRSPDDAPGDLTPVGDQDALQ